MPILIIIRIANKTTKKYLYKVPTNTLFTGKQIIHLPSCPSTNRFATDLMSENDIVEGTVIVTDHQTEGRGQRGNSWESAPGENLTFSLVLRPKFLQAQQQFDLNIVISLAISDLLLSYGLPAIKIKWPNDIYCNDGKVAGILIENIVGGNQALNYSIVGIGLNVNQLDFNDLKAVSMRNLMNRKYPLENVFGALLSQIEQHYLLLKQGAMRGIRNAYIANLYWLREMHYFKSDRIIYGMIMGVDTVGRLEIEEKGKISRFDSKQISFKE